MKVQLVSPLPDRGFAFNEGAYWPVGLLSIGTILRREVGHIDVEILDEALIGSEDLDNRLGADIVGIQASSNLTYKHVLDIAQRSKSDHGSLVVLGGPYATLMAPQILEARRFIDAVVSGPGEMPMVGIVNAARLGSQNGNLRGIPGVWTRTAGGSVTAPPSIDAWDFESARPFDYDLIQVRDYHRNFRRLFGDRYLGSFQIFTHFGCRYRDIRIRAGRKWCTYCALGEPLMIRDPGAILREVREALIENDIEQGSRLMLKCYGDNASALDDHLSQLADQLKRDAFLRNFDLEWSVYAQSSFVKPHLIDVFQELGVSEVYVGFDSVSDNIQRLNGLGTSRGTHLRAAGLLKQAGIRVQAGFVLGCEGESPESLSETAQFCAELRELGNVELFHASPLVVLAGSPAFHRLGTEIPEILSTDYVDPDVLQREWLGRFCPALGSGEDGQRTVRDMAESIASWGVIRSSFGG